jgi:putative transposase
VHYSRNWYRVESARLKEYDYSQNGIYFITICTKNKIPHFGKIITGKMVLSEIGTIAVKFWMEIKFNRVDYKSI